MTTQEIQQYVDTAIHSKFDNFTTQSGEMMTSEGGDGRFFGMVTATLYEDLPGLGGIYLAIGQTDKEVQIIKLGDSECLTPSETDLDLLLLKELGIEPKTEGK